MNQNKNIILCADGTGNMGGYTPDSSVYKIYKAVDLHHPKVKQIVFYDNGVGTQTNKYFRGLSGAFGFGFTTNVKDLYEYLSRNYQPGDNIYMFGFSRGAATIRAFNGFIYACGLVNGRDLGNKELKHAVKEAMKAYIRIENTMLKKVKRGTRDSSSSQSKAYDPAEDYAALRSQDPNLSKLPMHDEIPKIKFIGVWDTVSALGFPERKDLLGIGLWALHQTAKVLTSIYDKIDPYTFYNYELTPNVVKACQGLSLDDERTTFWPRLWDEKPANLANTVINQVWFAGMHSNVGGGYERAGMANVCFVWMAKNTPDLILEKGVLESAIADSNVNGRLYDSRQGFGTYYRYHPREIDSLCEEAGTSVKVHESVMERIRLRTANYAPTSLPKEFEVVDDESKSIPSPTVFEEHWDIFQSRMRKFIHIRKWLYAIFIELTFVLLILAIYLWIKPPVKTDQPINDFQRHTMDILGYFTPEFLDGLFYAAIIQKPMYTILAIILMASIWYFREYCRSKVIYYAECIRKLFIISPKPHPRYLDTK